VLGSNNDVKLTARHAHESGGRRRFILTLKSTQEVVREALKLPHNAERYVPPERPDVESRETTPFLEQENDEALLERPPQLRLTFDKPPRDITRGYSFGTERKRCDVLLGAKRREGNISGVHFYITFDKEGRITLKDESTHGTAVSYEGIGQEHKRRNFQWILFPGREIQVHLPNDFNFDIMLARHDTCNTRYAANVASYLKYSGTAITSLGSLNIESGDSSIAPSESLSPSQRPIYLPGEVLGEGSFGRVLLVTDVSTAELYAAKEPRRGMDLSKETAIMRGVAHVRFFGLSASCAVAYRCCRSTLFGFMISRTGLVPN
jgi:hypothetical protein